MLNLDTATMSSVIKDSAMIISLYEVHYNEIAENGTKTPKVEYMTDYGDIVEYNGNTYKSTPLKRTDLSTNSDGQIDNVTVSIGNLDNDRTIQKIIELGEVVGQNIILTELVIDPYSKAIIGAISITFTIKGIKATFGQVDFTLGIGFDFLINNLPGRKLFSKICRWPKFKDEYCKYAGPDTSCKRTYDACVEKQNQTNFGGTPGILNSRIYF